MPQVIEPPHAAIQAADERERLALRLFDALWVRYRSRVAYVRTYEQVVREAGAAFVNDHIAFRTFACQKPFVGVATLARIFTALGYEAAGCYAFPDKKLSSLHFQHPNPRFPKLFASELRTWELSEASRGLVHRALASHRAPPSDAFLSDLSRAASLPASRRGELLAELERFFAERPWDAPPWADVQALEKESQFGAWVLVHGCDVNHFTSSVNSHGAPALDDIEKTVAALRRAGVPMKAEIEGAPGSKLRQSATESVTIDVEIMDGGRPARRPWSYAYFELAERNEVVDPETGRRGRFEGFLGAQATTLFEMTKIKR